MRGHAVQIMHVKDAGYELDVAALEKILLAENVRDKKVVILSVAGAYRKGKSFLLSFLLRYLEAEGSPEWMGNPNEPLEGFCWEGGSEGCTSGILMWSEPFIIETPNLEEVAVILLDTQGAFDTNYDMGECATVFALSTMVSSVQVYNIMHNIEETDLHHLQLFTEYGRIAQEQGSSSTPFQKLLFLIRDWFHTQEAKHGIDGGEKYLNGKLSISNREKSELQLVRQHIKSSFSEICCFLMPFPGEEVAGSHSFDGRLSGISKLFKKHLGNLVPLLLAPENLVIKRIGGIEVTAKELSKYFQMYMKMFQGDKLPAPHTIYEATARANNLVAAERAKDDYITKMDEICCSGKPLMSSTELQDKHKELKQAAIDQFQFTSKMGERQYSIEYEQQLIKELDKMYDDYKKSNEEKLRHEEAMKEMQQKLMDELEKQTQKENLQTAVSQAKKYYKTRMDKICCWGKPSVSFTELQDKHQELKEAAISQFQITSKIGRGQFSYEHEQQLITKLDKMYDDYKKSNEEKLRHEEAIKEMERKLREELEKLLQKENLQKAVNHAKEYYKTRMNQICCSGNPSMSSTKLEDTHWEQKQAAIRQFQITCNMGERQFSCEYEQQLITELDKIYDDYKKSNEEKLRHEEALKVMERKWREECEKQLQKENLQKAVNHAKEYYKIHMDKICCSGKPSMSPKELQSKHQNVKKAALTQFQITNKMGERQFSFIYEQQLIMELDIIFEDYKKSNEEKLRHEEAMQAIQQTLHGELEKQKQKETLQKAVKQARQYYKTRMDEICSSGKPPMSSTELQCKHQELKEAAITQYQINSNMGERQLSCEYQQQLITELDKMYDDYKKSNKEKLNHEEAMKEMQQKLSEELENKMRKKHLPKAVNRAKEYYKTRMDEICCFGKPSMSSTELQDKHQELKEAAIMQFHITSNMGERQFSFEYEQQLITDLDKMYDDYKTSNEEKLRQEYLQKAVNDAKEYYKTCMDEICCSEKPSMSSAELQDRHQELKQAAITQFQITSEMGEIQFSFEYEQQLIMALDKMSDDYKKSNKEKLRHEEAMKEMECKLREELQKQTQKENLQKAVNHAKEYYKTSMDEICLGKPSLSSTELQDKHELHRNNAITQFQEAIETGEKQFPNNYEKELFLEMDKMYGEYVKSNEDKLRQEILQNAANHAKEYYKTCMDEICCSGKPTLNSTELQDRHEELKEDAITQFKIASESRERWLICAHEQQLITELDKMYDDYKNSNEEKLRHEEAMKEIERKLEEELKKQMQKENLEKAVNHVKEYYKTCMDEICLGKPLMSYSELQDRHHLHKNTAISQFQEAIEIGDIPCSGNYENEIFKEFDKMYDDYAKSNEEKHRQENLQKAVNHAKEYYKTSMDEICCLGKPSMSFTDLQDKHQELKKDAITQFQMTIQIWERQFSCNYEQQLSMELDKMYDDYKKSNEEKLRHEEAIKEMERKLREEREKQVQKENLQKAVNHAKEYYKTRMDEICLGKPSMFSTELEDKHQLHKNTTITQFHEAFEVGEQHLYDNYEKELYMELDKMYDNYVKSNEEKLKQESLQKAVSHAKEYYQTHMDEIYLGKPSMSSTVLQDKHQQLKEAAITEFQNAIEFLEEQFSDIYQQGLITNLDQMYTNIKNINEVRRNYEDEEQRKWKNFFEKIVAAAAAVSAAAGAVLVTSVTVVGEMEASVTDGEVGIAGGTIGAAAVGGIIGAAIVLVPRLIWKIFRRQPALTT